MSLGGPVGSSPFLTQASQDLDEGLSTLQRLSEL